MTITGPSGASTPTAKGGEPRAATTRIARRDAGFWSWHRWGSAGRLRPGSRWRPPKSTRWAGVVSSPRPASRNRGRRNPFAPRRCPEKACSRRGGRALRCPGSLTGAPPTGRGGGVDAHPDSARSRDWRRSSDSSRHAASSGVVGGALGGRGGRRTGGAIKIGGGFALTGDESALDLPAANGAKLAVDEINKAGGVLGSQIDFIVHDSQYKMDVTAQTAKQFVEQDKVPLMVGYTDTDSVLASGPTFQSRQDPVHHGGRDVAQDPVPGRRHDVPGLLRRQRAGGRRRRVRVRQVRQERVLPVGQGRRVHDPAGPVLQVALHGARRDDRPRGVVRRQGDRLLGPDHQDQGAQPGAGLLLRRRDAVQHRADREAVPRRRHHRADRRRRRLRHPGPRQGRRAGDEQRVLHDPRPDGRRERDRRDQEVHRRLQGRVRQRPRERVRRPRLRHGLPAGRRDQARRRHGLGGRQDGARVDQGLPGHHRQDHVRATAATSRRRA